MRSRRGRALHGAARPPAAPDPTDELAINVLPRQNMRRKLGRIVVATVIVQGVATGAALMLLQGPWRDRDRFDHGASMASLVADQLRGQRLASYNIFAQATLDRVVRAPSVRFAVIVDSAGEVVLESSANDQARRLIRPNLRERAAEDSRSTAAAPLHGLAVFETSISDLSGRRFRLLLGVHDVSAQRAMLDGAVALGVGAFSAALVALPIGLWRFRRWSSSLHLLHRGIRRLAMDAPLQPVAVSGDDEIAYLSLAFNDMAGKLTASRRDLLEANRVLEQRVAERTEELRVANAKLERQNITLEDLTETALRFTDDVAHEFRTPLAVINEFASILTDGIGGDLTVTQREYVQFISSASGELAHLVDDFLDSGKLRAGTLRVDRQPTRVQDILDHIWPMLQTRAATAKVIVERHVRPETLCAYVDREKFGRAIINLAINAIKFSSPGSRVVIDAAETERGAVSLSVIDKGPGIAPDEVTALFERFKQTRVGRGANVKGFGLGLNITRELVMLNLGEVSIASEVGKGSTFTIQAPSTRPEVIVDFYVRSLSQLNHSRIGLMWISQPPAQDGGSDLSSYVASFAYPSDLYLVRPGGGLLAAGPTDNIDGWRARLLREDAIKTRSAGSIGLRLQVDAATTYPIAEAKERILEGLARVPETLRRAA